MQIPAPPHHAARTLQPSGADKVWSIAEEVPVEIGFNGQAWTVMLATPQDLEDLALGLALTEGVIDDAKHVERIERTSLPEGITLDIQLDPSALNTSRLTRRALDGRTGCGLCGVERLADLHRPRKHVSTRTAISDDAVRRTFADLPQHQPLNQSTHSVHAAAWCSPDGTILTVREDVGRHNALDKLAGARLREPQDTPGFVALTSRCSFELVFKAARMSAATLATLSAPTGLALDLAHELDLPLITRGPGGTFVRFE